MHLMAELLDHPRRPCRQVLETPAFNRACRWQLSWPPAASLNDPMLANTTCCVICFWPPEPFQGCKPWLLASTEHNSRHYTVPAHAQCHASLLRHSQVKVAPQLWLRLCCLLDKVFSCVLLHLVRCAPCVNLPVGCVGVPAGIHRL